MAKKRKSIGKIYYMYRGLNHTKKEIFYGLTRVAEAHFYRYGLRSLSGWNGMKHKLEWERLSAHNSEAEARQAAAQEERTFVLQGYVSQTEIARRKSLKRRLSKAINSHQDIDGFGERIPIDYADWCVGIAAIEAHESLEIQGLGVSRLTAFKILNATFSSTAKYVLAYYLGKGLSASEHQAAESAYPKFVYIYKKPYKIRQEELRSERKKERAKDEKGGNVTENIDENVTNTEQKMDNNPK